MTDGNQAAKEKKDAGTEKGDVFSGIFSGDGSATKDAMGLTDEMIEGMYGQAYRLYNTGNYTDAIQLFRLLIMLNPTTSKYTLGLAACMHMLKEYRNAIELYTMCTALDPESPLPLYHASDCYLQIQDKLSAVVALEMAVQRAGENAQYKILKDRARLTIDSLKQDLKNQGVLK